MAIWTWTTFTRIKMTYFATTAREIATDFTWFTSIIYII
jgi:hypothetical protein